jgi:hypothetical protein
MIKKEVELYSDINEIDTMDYNLPSTLPELIQKISENVNCSNPKSLIYCNTIEDTVECAKMMSNHLKSPPTASLDEAADEIANFIHKDYYLVELVRKGVGFHFGKLPQKVRDIVEKLYGDAHSNTIAYQYKLVDLFHKAGEYEKGLPYILAACSKSVQVNEPNDRTTINCIMLANDIFFRIMGAESYDGKYNDEYTEFNKNMLVIATPAEGSYASQIGLNGKYIVVAYEEWTISDEADNFYVFGTSVNQREEKTYIFYKDGKYIKVPFTGRLGVSLNPMWIDASEKQAIIKSFDKTNKKKIKIAK